MPKRIATKKKGIDFATPLFGKKISNQDTKGSGINKNESGKITPQKIK